MARFSTVDDEEIALENKDSKNTKKSTQTLSNVLVSYCKEKRLDFDVEAISKDRLDDILSKFYVEVRKVDGTLYKKTSFYAIRFAIQRKFKITRGNDFDIIEGQEFAKCNEVFYAQCVVLKKKGLADIKHHPAISEEDIKKLYESDVFDLKRPMSLQRKVFFDIMLHFCRRGGENLRALSIHDFAVKVTGDGKEYVEKITDELDDIC